MWKALSTSILIVATQAIVWQENEHEQEQVGCVADINGDFFNLNPLKKDLDSVDPDKSKVYEVDIQSAKGGESTLKFNICRSAGRTCPDQVEDFANLMTQALDGQEGHCVHMSKPQDMPISYHGYNNMKLLNKDEPERGVSLTYNSSQKCMGTINYGLHIEISCNKDVFRTKYELDVQETNKNPCIPVIKMESPHGCPELQTGGLNKHNKIWWWLNGVLMMVLGLFFLGVGARAPLISMFLAVTIIVGTCMTLGMYVFVFPAFMPGWTVWIIGGVCYGIAGGLGIGAMRWPKMGVTLCGLVVGYGLGQVIWHLVSLSELSNPYLPHVLTLSSTTLMTMIGFVFMYDYAIIVSCALFGSFSFVRGLALMIKGSYPNEIMLYFISHSGQTKLLPWTVWFYWSIMFILAIMSIATQLKGMSNNKELYSYGDRTLTWRAARQRKNISSGIQSKLTAAKAAARQETDEQANSEDELI